MWVREFTYSNISVESISIGPTSAGDLSNLLFESVSYMNACLLPRIAESGILQNLRPQIEMSPTSTTRVLHARAMNKCPSASSPPSAVSGKSDISYEGHADDQNYNDHYNSDSRAAV